MFRQEALENRKRKWTGRAMLLKGAPVWLSLTVTLFFIIAFFSLIICGSFTRRINVSGEVTTFPRPVNVYSPASGYVAKQYVNAGDLVKKGDSIYLVDTTRFSLDGTVDTQKKIEIKSQINRINDIVNHMHEKKMIVLQELSNQKKQYENALIYSSSLLKDAQEGMKIFKKNMTSYELYQHKGLINKEQLNNQVAMYYQQQSNVLSLSSQNKQNMIEVGEIESKMHIQSVEVDNEIYQMELKRIELQKELIGAEADNSTLIKSASDGVIDSMNITRGQMVHSGDSLLQIIPSDAKTFYVVIWVPNSAIPYITLGMNVNIRYEAFPAQKFGQFAGKIITLSKTPATQQEILSYHSGPDRSQLENLPYYKVIIEPLNQKIFFEKKMLPLQNGMKAVITLFLEKRKIYQWMATPFYDMKNSISEQVNNGK
ncbi:UNVERIFIED_ORG: membrane fusion protein [Pantoea agglomerans]|uniref:HlyD family secretion protein n=1 Tax=Pantoea TaxID=53335 RepID=UPI000CF48804|nr:MULTISPECIES: HlyD family secretion protein [Pantoea]MCS4496738.1 HlyD family secretion protein [Pantoea sp. B623]PQK80009.1 colicin V secretion protein CvaA [Pantoea ananatis]